MHVQPRWRVVWVLFFSAALLTMMMVFLQANRPATAATPPAQMVVESGVYAPLEPDPEWLALVQAASAGEAAESSGLSLSVDLTRGYVAGRAPSPLPVSVQVWDGAQLLGEDSVNPGLDGSGFFYSSFVYCSVSCPNGLFAPGYEVRVLQGSQVISMSVPLLTVQVDASTELVSGQSTPGASLQAYAFPDTGSDAVYSATTTVAVDGGYSLDFSGVYDLQPRDRGYVALHQDALRSVYRYFRAPFLQVLLDSRTLFGVVQPYQWVEIAWRRDAETITTLYESGNEDGVFWIDMDDYQWLPTAINQRFHPGDQLQLMTTGQAFTHTLQPLDADLNSVEDWVMGTTTPGEQVLVRRFSGPLPAIFTSVIEWWRSEPLDIVSATASADGVYSASLPLRQGDFGVTAVRSVQGFETLAWFSSPYMEVWLDEFPGFNAKVQVSQPWSPVQLDMIGPSGYLKDQLQGRADAYGRFDTVTPYFERENLLQLASGDTLRLFAGEQQEMTLIVPLLTVDADPLTDRVSGQAPPGALVTVTLALQDDLSWTEVQETAVADANGLYQVDFAALGGFNGQADGTVELHPQEGQRLVRWFAATPDCPPSIYQVSIGINLLYMNSRKMSACQPFRLRLEDAQGVARFDQQIDPRLVDLWDYSLSQDGQAVIIQSGDRFEVSSPEGQYSFQVPELTVELDPKTDTISGRAVPSQTLAFSIQRPPGFDDLDHLSGWITASANAQGDYSVQWTGDLLPGSWVMAEQTGVGEQEQQISFERLGVAPAMLAELYGTNVQAVLPPLQPFTATQTRAGEVIQQRTGRSNLDGRAYIYLERLFPGDQIKLQTPENGYLLDLPAISVSINLDGVTVGGSAPPGLPLWVVIPQDNYEPPFVRTQVDKVIPTAVGTFVAYFPELAPLQSMSGYLFHFTANGHIVQMDFSTPYWDVMLGDDCVHGISRVPGVPADISLQSTDLSFSQTITQTWVGSNGNFSACFDKVVEAGDRLTLHSPNESRSFTVFDVTAEHDVLQGVILGTSLPDRRVEVRLSDRPGSVYPSPYSSNALRLTRTDAQGNFGLDINDLEPTRWESGLATVVDRWGNQVRCGFELDNERLFVPLVPVQSVPKNLAIQASGLGGALALTALLRARRRRNARNSN